MHRRFVLGSVALAAMVALLGSGAADAVGPSYMNPGAQRSGGRPGGPGAAAPALGAPGQMQPRMGPGAGGPAFAAPTGSSSPYAGRYSSQAMRSSARAGTGGGAMSSQQLRQGAKNVGRAYGARGR